MAEKKPGRRAYLKDFVKLEGGDYLYTGAYYGYASRDMGHRGAMIAQTALSGAMTALAVLGGVIPAPGMKNCFYVILPWLAALLSAVSALWAAVRTAKWGDPLRAYVYEKSTRGLPGRALLSALCAAATAAGTALYLLLDGREQVGPLCTCVFFFLQIGIFGSAMALRRLSRTREWKKQADTA